MSGRGFLPLASSVLSSEPDIEAPKRKFEIITPNVTTSVRAKSRLKPVSKFSFEGQAPKRLKALDVYVSTVNENVHPDARLAQVLLQPVKPKNLPAFRYGDIDGLMNSSLTLDHGILEPVELDLSGSTQSIFDCLESFETLESTLSVDSDPFFGAPSRLEIPSAHPPRCTRLISVHELASTCQETPDSMKIKGIFC